MKSEFSLAFNEIIERSGLSRETVMEALEAAMVSAYRRSVNASSAQNIEAHIDPETGEPRVFAEKEVVESVENPLTEVEHREACKVDPDVEIGSVILVDSTPADFGRVAAQTAKQVILQRLREAERDAQYEEYIEREGDMVHGTIHSITPQAVSIGLGRAEAILPRIQQIPGEHFRVRDRVRVYVLEVRKSSRGPVIIVSRAHPYMLRRLLEMEVPEINQGLVEIKAIAREAGKRAKVAVAALREGVDPVGACVGLRGVRIQSIVRDLNDEKIDVIEWNPDPAIFIAKALSPARVSGVYLDDDPGRGKTAAVVVPEDQLSLAIGRSGVNARLAAKLTNWRIDIKSLPEATAESLHLLQAEAMFAKLAKSEAKVIEQVEITLTKKAENRPIPPEDYQVMTGFVDRVQRAIIEERDEARQVMQEKLAEIQASIKPSAYQTTLEELGLSPRVLRLLLEANYRNAGIVMEQLLLDEDKILGLQGFGPKAIEELRKALSEYPFPEVKVEEAPEIEVEQVEGALAEELLEEAVLEAAEFEVEPIVEMITKPGTEVVAPEAEMGVGRELEPEAVVEEVVEAPKSEVSEEVGEEAPTAVEIPEPVVLVDESDLDRVFARYAKSLGVFAKEGEVEVEQEEETGIKQEKKSKKKKKGARVVEYDPESDKTYVKRRRKRGSSEDWEDY